MHIHCHTVQLLQRSHCFEKKNHATAAFDCLDGAREQVWSHGLKVLKHKHSVCVPQDGVRFIVVTIPYLGGSDEHLKRVILNGVDVNLASLRLFFDFFNALLLVRAEAQLFLITPQHCRTSLDSGF